ncbi:hypothetical protein C0995_000184 [Termitomyces sp. Mi166|nr:hypothetical protein C0995_000184 [Termitomyces sp. Mi166\
MSRGDRVAVAGNLSHSMRENYQQGVSETRSGEATVAFQEWWQLGRKLFGSRTDVAPGDQQSPERLPQKKPQVTSVPIGPELGLPRIFAADPSQYTSVAYRDRIHLPCSTLSFKDIAEGALPPLSTDEPKFEISSESYAIIDMIICSFALHLVESPSELFSLLWELSSKARWLVILAPHKKPERWLGLE